MCMLSIFLASDVPSLHYCPNQPRFVWFSCNQQGFALANL
uniref:Uncharacterized protein n=1 Tax=Populus trichocarpa TaxID=3694 RepID=A9P8F1_POPTR|nr:unknown [Populus trichocarpa]